MALKVLVVDDDSSARRFAEMAVKRAVPDADVHTAIDGVDARTKAAEWRPDALVLDHMMPKLDGWRYLEEIRKSDWGKRTPVLFYSALDLKRDISRIPCAVFLQKPSTLDGFVAAFKHALAMK